MLTFKKFLGGYISNIPHSVTPKGIVYCAVMILGLGRLISYSDLADPSLQ